MMMSDQPAGSSPDAKGRGAQQARSDGPIVPVRPGKEDSQQHASVADVQGSDTTQIVEQSTSVSGSATKERKRKFWSVNRSGGAGKKVKTRTALRKISLAAFALWTVSCLALGVILGWGVHDRVQAGRTTAGPSVIEIPALEQSDGFAMPDLRGLPLPDAKQVIVDGGADVDLIDVLEVEWGGQAGLVISQDPVSGEQVAARIQLQVSKQATMPDLVGMSELEAVDRLKTLGVEAVVEQRFDLAARTGTVLEASVSAGEVLPTVVNLVVAQPGAAVYLAQLKMADGGCSGRDGRINGRGYPNSTECRSGTSQNPSTGVWLLDRKVHQLTGVIGVDDRGKVDAAVQVIITGDGKELVNATATYANPVEVSVSVKDVLRLEIAVISEKQSSAMLGDMLVKGIPEEIETLEKRQ
ncbi:MAG: PASTA domain-containing protein [Arachnia propionica]|uniref:PASTA domain-containing protein n=1 Tax=Arachnia propionica TaxID=1750 RepID=UPI0027041066|nr:PASTA domain-containing protein [Arachnia propionica]